MKSTKTAYILVFIAMFFVGCSKNMDYPDPIAENLTTGNFTVHYFFEGQDKTASYNGYVFEFGNDGALNCKSATGDFQGRWQLVKKVDGPAIKISLLAPSTDLQNLSREWDLVANDHSKIELKQANASLRFRK
jgi:hypothetical protein